MPTESDKTNDAKVPGTGDAPHNPGLSPTAKPEETAGEPKSGSVGIPADKAAEPSRQPS